MKVFFRPLKTIGWMGLVLCLGGPWEALPFIHAADGPQPQSGDTKQSSEPDIRRYGFEIELDEKQLERVIDLFDFEAHEKKVPDAIRYVPGAWIEDYLEDPANRRNSARN